jgi:putative membrane protein
MTGPNLDTRHLASFISVSLGVGLGLFTTLIAYNGVHEIAASLAVAGAGLLAVALFHLAPLLAAAVGWHTLLRGTDRPRLRTMLRARWVAESINQLLPVLQVGGNLVRAQLLARSGVAGTLAGASVVVDVTLHLVAQLVFTALGLGLLLVRLGPGELAGRVTIGLVLTAAGAACFYLAQRRGLFETLTSAIERFVRTPEWLSLTASGAAMDARVRGLYGARETITASCLWHLVNWMLGTGEVWLVLRFLGHPVGVADALLLESLVEAIRTAAFAVPGALGVQEGGFLVLGAMLGLTPQTSLALSLAKRVRELLLGLPGLVAWQVGGVAGALVTRALESGEGGEG